MFSRQEYLMRFPLCQYTLTLRDIAAPFCPHQWCGLETPRRVQPSTEIDHIFGRRGQKADVWHPSNLMASCSAAHRWKTDCDVPGRIVALYCQWQLRRQGHAEYFDRNVQRRVFGRDPIAWVEAWLQSAELPEWVERLALDMLEGAT